MVFSSTTVAPLQALGNLIDVILFIALASIPTWLLFDVFAAFLLLVTLWYCVHVHNYKYAEFLQKATPTNPTPPIAAVAVTTI